MDLSDLPRRHLAAAGAATPLDPQALTAQLGSEVAGALTSALDRVTALTVTGRIDRESLRALRDEIDRARRAGIVGQQIARLASGSVHVAHERVDVTALLREALRQRAREIVDRGIDLRQNVAAAAVAGDSTLVFALLQATLDWCFRHALVRVDLVLEARAGRPVRLSAAFAHRPDEAAFDAAADALAASGESASEAALDTMPWRLVQQIAALLGLALDRRDTPTRTAVTIEFPTSAAAPEGFDGHRVGADADADADDIDAGVDDAGPDPFDEFAEHGAGGRPAAPRLAGLHVLVLAARRDVRVAVRDALRRQSMTVDFVYTADAAFALCEDAVPDAVVWEAALGDGRFDRLRAALSAGRSAPAFIEIADEGPAPALPAGRHGPRIGRDAVATALPAMLAAELARVRDRHRGR